MNWSMDAAAGASTTASPTRAMAAASRTACGIASSFGRIDLEYGHVRGVSCECGEHLAAVRADNDCATQPLGVGGDEITDVNALEQATDYPHDGRVGRGSLRMPRADSSPSSR